MHHITITDGKKICDFCVRYEYLLEDISVLDEILGTEMAKIFPVSKNTVCTNYSKPLKILAKKQIQKLITANRRIYGHFDYKCPSIGESA